MLCLTNIGFVQCYSLGCPKVCCTLVFNFALFSNFCIACFASQISGLCSAFPSAPVKSVTRFCYALVRTLFCVFCLTNTGSVQFYSLGSSSLLYACVYFALFINFFAHCVLPHQHRSCWVLFPSAPLKFTPFCFSLFFFSLLLLCVLCPTSSGLCSDFSPAPLEFARFTFCFVLFRFKFVFCVFFLTNLIFLRFL